MSLRGLKSRCWQDVSFWRLQSRSVCCLLKFLVASGCLGSSLYFRCPSAFSFSVVKSPLLLLLYKDTVITFKVCQDNAG